MPRYEEMTDDQVIEAVTECILATVSECRRSEEEGGARFDDIRLALRSRLGVDENTIGLFISPTPIADRLPKGEFSIRVMALAPSENVLDWTIPANKFVPQAL